MSWFFFGVKQYPLNLTGSTIVSQCAVVAGADLESVWLDATCNGYGGLPT